MGDIKEHKDCLLVPSSKKRKQSSNHDQPIFHKPGTVNKDFLEDCLYYLNKKTHKELKSTEKFRDYLAPERVVETIFWICTSLRQPPEVMYVSVEIFDRFIVSHLSDINSQLQTRILEGKPEVGWSDVELRLKKQIFLRILSCIQLASKLNSHNKCISISEVSYILNHLGCNFSNENILNSELRVFKTLNYRIDVLSPLAYAETLLEILNFNNPHFQPEIIYKTTLALLDLYYMSRHKFYSVLYKMARGEESLMLSPTDAVLMRSVKSDYMLLTSAILITTGSMHSEQLQNFLLNGLSKISGNTKEDLQILNQALIAMILNT